MKWVSGHDPGFTLIEVMVAMVIIAIAMVTLLSTHAISTKNYADAKTMLVCTLLAQQKLAELQMGEFPEAGEQSGGFEDNENYQWKLTVRETDLEELREVTVDVFPAPQEGSEEAPALQG